MSYITIQDLSDDLGIYEYQIRTTYGDTSFNSGTTLTGSLSGETMTVVRAEEAGSYFVNQISGLPTLGETLTDSGSNTATLINSDYNALDRFIKRSQGIIEDLTNKKILNTGTQITDSFTTSINKNTFLLSKLPVISIDAITLNNNAFTGDEDSSYYVNNKNGVISFTSTTVITEATYRPNLDIQYTYGDASATIADVPYAIVQVLVSSIMKMYDKWIATITAPGATSINPAGFAMTFKQEDLLSESDRSILLTHRRMLL